MHPPSGFLETDAGKILAGAHMYLSAARELCYSKTSAERSRFLLAPTTHLIAHGVELLLKYPLLATGMPIEDVRNRFGHNLMKLWNDDANTVIRSLMLDRASEAWEEAKKAGLRMDSSLSHDPRREIKDAVTSLSYLHGHESSFALRYVAPSGTVAPRPAFLVDVFGDVAERGVKNPRCLVESW